ncbi:MAG TPA: hypothetical protein VM734_36920, partial [Kofleriaceae bacterium]|nr:hypothetical protein [Kofleriaceae bacterium]
AAARLPLTAPKLEPTPEPPAKPAKPMFVPPIGLRPIKAMSDGLATSVAAPAPVPVPVTATAATAAARPAAPAAKPLPVTPPPPPPAPRRVARGTGPVEPSEAAEVDERSRRSLPLEPPEETTRVQALPATAASPRPAPLPRLTALRR